MQLFDESVIESKWRADGREVLRRRNPPPGVIVAIEIGHPAEVTGIGRPRVEAVIDDVNLAVKGQIEVEDQDLPKEGKPNGLNYNNNLINYYI